MKFLIASDIHGSAFYTKKLLEVFKAENADKIILLGDIYNHGPRNPLPEEYSPAKVSELLNSVKDKLIVVKGNCDSQVDTLISEFSFIEDLAVVSGGKTVFCTHGHVFNKDNMPATAFDAVVYGHFHTGFIERNGSAVVANAGSLSLPKNGTPSSYLILDEGNLTLKDVDGKVIASVEL
ncbi:MAG: phosphodiesterase [Clostridia bacterium]|nr:phosphodiesterase [Clostridia bacterium]